MKKKNEFNYFDAFINQSNYASVLAEILRKTLDSFDASALPSKLKEMHEIEHSADLAKHEVMNHLVKEFLPPIEREDITKLSQDIDDVTDSVEDVLIFISMFNIKKIRPEVLKFAALVEKCCKSLADALTEFKSFKNSKTLKSKIIEVNDFEEEADRLYIDMISNLYRTSTDPIELMTWTEIMNRLEACCDSCEDVADIIEEIVLKNS
jgi:predicted phosphate transport protein (TIGR00153 family)